jgi:pimeloyl-ACP methyl ester carboxylesterase
MSEVPADGYDWGQRCPRWTGLRSQLLPLGGGRVHLLRADAAASAPPCAPTHLLIHSMGAGSWSWLDAMGPLSALGPVLAPDLPGSGWTPPVRRQDPEAGASARFLRDLLEQLGLERVVIHGHSMGGLVAVLLAQLDPGRTWRMVLAAPALAAAPDDGPQRLTRLALWAAPPALRLMARLSLPGKARSLQQWRTDPAASPLARAGGDPARISPEMFELLLEQLEAIRTVPWRVDSGVTAFLSTARAMTVGQREIGEAIDEVTAPTLLLWGEQDQVLPKVLMEALLARRPDWTLERLSGVGHLLPWEIPGLYAQAVGRWLGPWPG